MKQKLESKMAPDLARSVVKNYVCAGCYGQLVETYDRHERMSTVECPSCGPERGFVTREYADRRQAESRVERFEARWNLSKIMPDVIKETSNDQVLKEVCS